MRKIVKESLIKEGYGAGYSFTGGFGGFKGGTGGTTRGGFGGAWNYGGPNMMYTYEVKPLTHTLEQLPNTTLDQQPEIKVGSVIVGEPVRSNAYPERGKKVKGVVHKIVLSDNGALKYYIVQDEATQINIKIDPLTASLKIPEPVEYYIDTDILTSRRKEKIKNAMKESKLVAESIEEFLY